MTGDINDKDLINKRIKESNISVYAYDLAIVQDMKARFKNPELKQQEVNDIVQMGPADSMFQIIGTLNEDAPILPFISLQRTDWQLNLDRQMFQAFQGDKVYIRSGPDEKPMEVRAQVIPITINYRLSVWTRDRVTNDALVRELLWYYSLRPSLLVYINHGLNIAHKFNIYFNSGIEDNSDIANFNTKGELIRQDLTFYTESSYLWRAQWQPLVEIQPDLYFSYGVDNDKNTQLIDFE